MIKLKRKIRKIDNFPTEKSKGNIIGTIFTFLFLGLLGISGYYAYKYFFYQSYNINNIVGKKININECNIKDYIMINKDKSYSLSLTNDECITKYYEGNLKVEDNNIIFNKKITGVIDKDNNILINNNLFKEEQNE